jgi:cytochrome c556
MKKISRRMILGAAVLALGVAVGAGSGEEHKTFRPVAPEREYYKLRNLMASGMMPNYKALWSSFRKDDAEAMRECLRYMEDLAGQARRYPLPDKAEASPDDFRGRLFAFQQETRKLASTVQTESNRSAVSTGILSVYQSCQSCHDRYAPAERADARKYSPPPE